MRIRLDERVAVPAFFLSTFLLFFCTGLDRFTYPFFAVSGACASWLLFLAIRKRDLSVVPHVVFLPLLLVAYTALSPGLPFKDMPMADKMLAAYLTGLSASVFLGRTCWRLVLGMASSIGGSLIWYVVAGFPEWMAPEGRLVLFFHHPNVLGAAAAWCVMFIVTRRAVFPGNWRYVAFAAAFLCTAALLLSAGRSACLGAAVVCLFWGCTFLKRHFLKIAVVLVCACALAYAGLPAQQQERFRSAIGDPLDDPTFKSRLPIWAVTRAGIAESPWFGNSARGFYDYHANYLKEHGEELRRLYPVVEPRIGHPHNIFLGIPYVYGVMGTVLFLACFAPAVVQAYREKDAFFPSVLVFYLSYGIFEFSLHRKEGLLLLFFPLGLVYGRRLAAALQGQTPADRQQTGGGEAEQDFRSA